MVSLPFSSVQSTVVGSEVSAPSANSDVGSTAPWPAAAVSELPSGVVSVELDPQAVMVTRVAVAVRATSRCRARLGMVRCTW